MTIAVYTCSRSCAVSDEGSAYADEFVFVQPAIVEYEAEAMPVASEPIEEE